MIGLRDYQERGIAALRDAYRRGRRSPILVSPTGSGKSRCCAAIAELTISKGGRVLALAPRLEILGQLVKECASAGIPVRSIQAENDEGPGDAPVTVASIWTLATPRWKSQLPPADLVIIDECHRSLAERSYREVLNNYASSKLLGMTATPARSDSRALGDVFDELVVATTVAELTDRKFLVPCNILRPSPGAPSGVLALPVVEAYQQHAAGRLAIVFAASVSHARQLLSDFTAAGIPSALVTGTTPDDERAGIMASFGSGSVQVLVNVNCFVEGLDVPSCSCAILARKFGHIGPYLQAIGRTLRPSPGKNDSLILDLLGSALEHGPPDLPQTYSLEGKGIRATILKDQIRQCATCGSISLAGPAQCAYCGAEYPVRAQQSPRAGRAGLVALDGTPPKKREFVVTIESKYRGTCVSCGGAYARGDRIYWATVAKKAKHVHCPPRSEATAP